MSVEVKYVPTLSPPVRATLIDAVTRTDAKGKDYTAFRMKVGHCALLCSSPCRQSGRFDGAALISRSPLGMDWALAGARGCCACCACCACPAALSQVARRSGAVDYLEHRFSDFVALDAALRLDDLVPAKAVLPAKRWFGNSDPGVVEDRRLRLQVILGGHSQIETAAAQPSRCERIPIKFRCSC